MVAVALSSLAVAPLGYGARRRRLERRRSWVAARPHAALDSDVVDLLRRSGLLAREARELSELARERGVRPAELFGWLHRIDGDERVALFRGGLSHVAVVDHVRRGTVPALADLARLAAPVLEPVVTEPAVVADPVVEAEAVVAEAVGAAVLEAPGEPAEADDEGAVAVAVLPATAEETATGPAVVEPPAVAAAIDDPESAATATATLLGSGLGTQTPVP